MEDISADMLVTVNQSSLEPQLAEVTATAPILTRQPELSQATGDSRLAKPASLCHEQPLQVSVMRPQKKGDGMSAYVVYTVNHSTKLEHFSSSGGGSVTHRFSDFLALWERLRDRYASEGVVLPPKPEKSIIGAAKVKLGSGGGAGGVANDDEFVERRRGELERFLTYCCEHPRLRLDADLCDFLERPGAVSVAAGGSGSGSGLGGVLRAFTSAVAAAGGGASGSSSASGSKAEEESDPWFEELYCRLQQQESSLRPWHAAASRLATKRRDYARQAHQLAASMARAAAIAEFPAEAAALSGSSDSSEPDGCHSARLMVAFGRLAETEDRIASLQAAQAECEFAELCEQLRHHLAMLESLRSACHERRRLRRCQADAEAGLSRRREERVKLERAGRDLTLCETQIAEAEAAVDRCRSDFESASAAIKSSRIGSICFAALSCARLCCAAWSTSCCSSSRWPTPGNNFCQRRTKLAQTHRVKLKTIDRLIVDIRDFLLFIESIYNIEKVRI
ncbi:hypothetical protein BOX15_Mlig027315g1 [Macrostomum lignano]|uniref:PX domain-containing protein n=1 Tax=Macrostomum lignano TaxID=282301 RepID=A0A267GS29_9PLAT|nr:hypothetical protein BOX15_Mlig027315g1 [Macrostomum lignano]